jgi:hypothetical protein
MLRLGNLCSVMMWFLVIMFPSSNDPDRQPVKHIDLHPYGSESQWGGHGTVVTFTNQFLVVYSSHSESRLVFDKDTYQFLPEEPKLVTAIPGREQIVGVPLFRKAFPAVNIIARRKQMSIEQIGGIGLPPIGDSEYYLQEPGKANVLLFRGRCISGDPSFVGDEYILIGRCDGTNVVLNKLGRPVYKLPRLNYPYIAVNSRGTRFVIYEREKLSIHPFENTYKVRIRVFRSFDGKQLFEYRLHPRANEGSNDARVALSDDGSLLALVGAGDILIFSIH